MKAMQGSSKIAREIRQKSKNHLASRSLHILIHSMRQQDCLALEEVGKINEFQDSALCACKTTMCFYFIPFFSSLHVLNICNFPSLLNSSHYILRSAFLKLFTFSDLFCFMCVSVCECVCVYCMRAWFIKKEVGVWRLELWNQHYRQSCVGMNSN